MATVEGLPLNLSHEEIKNMWFLFIGCILGIVPFETYVIYLLKYGKNLCGNSEGATNTNFALNNSAVNQCPGSNNNTQLYYKPTVAEKDDVVQDGEARADRCGGTILTDDNRVSDSVLHNEIEVSVQNQEQSKSMGTTVAPCTQYRSGHLPRHMPAVEGLRIIGAIHIVLFHFYLFENKETECLPCRMGEWWVHVFFFITGIVSYKSCSRQKTTKDSHAFGGLRLLEKRLKNVYPLIFISFVMVYFAKLYIHTYVTSVSVLRIMLLTSSWSPPFSDSSLLNGPVWYISNLVLIWPLLPHWAHAMRRASRFSLISMTILLYAGSFSPFVTRYGLLNVSGDKDQNNVLAAMCNFSPYTNLFHVPMGMALAAMLDRRYADGTDSNGIQSLSSWGRELLEKCGATVGVIAMAILFALYDADTISLLYKGPLSYPVLYILFTGTSNSKDIMSRLLSCIKDFGKYSLPLYILHIPIQRVVFHVFGCRPGDTVNVHFYYICILPFFLVIGTLFGSWFHNWWTNFCFTAN